MNYKTIARETLNIEAKTLFDAAKNIDDVFDKAVEVILNCKGKLVVTGVGKSGLIGAKMAATFASTGTPSFFFASDRSASRRPWNDRQGRRGHRH